MNKFLKNYLERYSLEQHLVIALCLGLLFRLLASFFVYTPMALDDLGHSWLQAIRLSDGLTMQLPEYRTTLFPYLLFLFIKIASFFGLTTDPINKVYAMNIGLGLISLLGILGSYYYCKASKNSNRYFSILMYFFSVYALMPFISTRAGGECFCISFLMLGIGLLKYQKIFLGFSFLGIAVLFRYQLGLIYILYGIYGFKRKHLIYAFIVGLILLFIEGGKDVLYGRGIFQTLFAYLEENQKPYNRMAWYNLILFALALCAFPFCCVMFNKIKDAYTKHKEAVIAIVIILVTHSAVPHKEERFILPILPFLFIFLSGLWSESVNKIYARRIFSPVFLTANMFFLFVTTFIPSQTGLIDPLLEVNKKLAPNSSAILNAGFSKWAYGVYLKNNIQNIDLKKGENPQIGKNINTLFVLASSEETLFKPEGFSCDLPKSYTSVTDKILYELNPKFNSRKKATASMVCERIQSK